MHPLTPRARWLILPALSIALGWAVAFAGSLLTGQSREALTGAALAGAAGISTALSAKPWVGYLAAPPLGVLLFAAACPVQGHAAPSVLLPMMLQSPKLLFVIAMLTAPVVVLHGIRMRRPTSWAVVGLGFYAFAGMGAAVAESLMGGGSGPVFMRCLSFDLGLYLANAAAMEVSLRMSRTR
jgi:hypothetical protein